MTRLENFIGGRFVPADGARPRDIVDPATGEAYAVAPDSTREHTRDAVAAALSAQDGWAEHTPAERSEKLLAVAETIDAHAQELAAIDQRNAGKPLHVAAEEPRAAADVFRFYAGAVRNVAATAAGEYARGTTSMLRRDPIGVVACIAPWNYPLSTAAARIAPALAAGNAVVLKPSELTPLSALRLGELTAGILPAGTMNVVTGEGATVGDELSRHHDVAMITMTGSTASGRKIREAASHTLKRVELELGGNAPVIVFPDADLDALTTTLRSAAFWNSGQECGAASRIIVHRSRREELLTLLVPMMQSIALGDPGDAETEMGPLISAAQRDRVATALDAAVAAGASIVTGGGSGARSAGFFLEPTLVVDAPAHADLVREETFAPVLTVQSFDDEDEALRLAHATPYTLSGSVWTSEIARGMRVARSLRTGTAWINTHLVFFPEMPWGGPGASGGGVDGSAYALEAHTTLRHVMIAHD